MRLLKGLWWKDPLGDDVTGLTLNLTSIATILAEFDDGDVDGDSCTVWVVFDGHIGGDGTEFIMSAASAKDLVRTFRRLVTFVEPAGDGDEGNEGETP